MLGFFLLGDCCAHGFLLRSRTPPALWARCGLSNCPAARPRGFRFLAGIGSDCSGESLAALTPLRARNAAEHQRNRGARNSLDSNFAYILLSRDKLRRNGCTDARP